MRPGELRDRAILVGVGLVVLVVLVLRIGDVMSWHDLAVWGALIVLFFRVAMALEGAAKAGPALERIADALEGRCCCDYDDGPEGEELDLPPRPEADPKKAFAGLKVLN